MAGNIGIEYSSALTCVYPPCFYLPHFYLPRIYSLRFYQSHFYSPRLHPPRLTYCYVNARGVNVNARGKHPALEDQQSGYDARYTFSAKEKDDETQYSYFGARYYDSDLSVWLSVDPFTDDYPSESGYMYCGGNPVYYKDIDGNFKFPTAADEQAFAKAYPTFYNYIKNTDAASGSIMDMAKSQRVVNALIDNSAAESKLTLEKIIEDFTYNQGNTIYLSENESYNVDKFGDIYLSKNMLQSVEDALKNNDNTAATGAMTWSVSSIIHEYLENFSDDIIMTANNTPTDKGCIEMERDVWGLNLFSVEDGIRSVNMRNGTLIDEKTLQIIIDMSVIPVFESNTDE